MKVHVNSNAIQNGLTNLCQPKAEQSAKELLTTKQAAHLAGFSASYFEKGRIYGYGPKFLRVTGAGRNGRILYRRTEVEAWLAAQECDPEVCNHDR